MSLMLYPGELRGPRPTPASAPVPSLPAALTLRVSSILPRDITRSTVCLYQEPRALNLPHGTYATPEKQIGRRARTRSPRSTGPLLSRLSGFQASGSFDYIRATTTALGFPLVSGLR